MNWIAPSRHEPDWHLVDKDGNLIAKIIKGPQGWDWTVYSGERIWTTSKSPSRTAAKAKALVLNEVKSL